MGDDRERAMAEIRRRSEAMADTRLSGLGSPADRRSGAPRPAGPELWTATVTVEVDGGLDAGDLADAALAVLHEEGVAQPMISVLGQHLDLCFEVEYRALHPAVAARSIARKALERAGAPKARVLHVASAPATPT